MESCEKNDTFRKYYQMASASKSAVETLAGKHWEAVPDYGQFDALLKRYTGVWLDRFLSKHEVIYEYFVYLRHHGFPSPLLDWSASPYVAAFFAFDKMPKEASHIAIHALPDALDNFSADEHLFFVGSYIKTDPRHVLHLVRTIARRECLFKDR